MENVEEKIEEVLSHIKNVQNNCYKLGIKLIRDKRHELGRNLIRNGQIHDNSKFTGIEFEHLFPGSIMLADVVKHHNTTNPHHPEYWGDIHQMPELFLAELVCDCCARGAEMGTNTREWFENVATKKYNFSMNDEIGIKIKYFLDMLLTPVFKKL